MNGLAQEFERTLKGAADRLGVELADNLDEVKAYATEQMLLLAAAVDEPGYDAVLTAATMNVALKAAGAAVVSADAVDRELTATIFGALAMGARAFATGQA